MNNDKLEKEAKRYATDIRFENEGEDVANFYDGDVKDAFIAGAEYQHKEDTRILYNDIEVQAMIRNAVDKVSPLFHENLKIAMADELFEEMRKMEPRRFYRTCNTESKRGLWYNYDGTFSGIIHDDFKFCTNSDLKMEFDPKLVGWLSTCDTLEGVYQWFSKESIIELQKRGWYIHEFEATQYRFYDRFQHHIIKQDTSKLIRKIIIE